MQVERLLGRDVRVEPPRSDVRRDGSGNFDRTMRYTHGKVVLDRM